MLIRILFFVFVCQQAYSQTIEPIIFDRTGNPVSGSSAQISEDGRFIAFTSTSNNIVEEDTNYRNRGFYERGPAADVFLLDRDSMQYKRISLAEDGLQIEGGESLLLSVNQNFDKFLYTSIGNTKFPGDTFDPFSHSEFDILFFDLTKNQTSWLSKSLDGSEGNSDFRSAILSKNGKYVIIYSGASNLLPSSSPYNSEHQLIRMDLETNERELVSMSVDGIQPQVSTSSREMAISENGRYIAYISPATNLTKEGVGGILLRDMEAKSTELISRSPDGVPIEFEFLFDPERLDMSDDGRYIYYTSTSNLHVNNDPHPDNKTGMDGFIYDRVTQQTKVVPLKQYYYPERRNSTRNAKMSANGRYIVFSPQSLAGQNYELYLYDQYTGTIELLISEEMNHPLIQIPEIGIQDVTSDGKYILFSNTVYLGGIRRYPQSNILYLMTRDVTSSHINDWELLK